MQTFSAPDIINALQSCRHKTSENRTPSLFDTPHDSKSTEYWFLSDLYNIVPGLSITISKDIHDQLYNMAKTQSNLQTLASLQHKPSSFYQILSQHTEQIKRDYTLQQQKQIIRQVKNGNDLKLSRFACFTIVYNTRHNPTAYLATAYFMQPNATDDQIIQIANDINRATERARCKNLEKTMCSIINNQTNIPIGVFYNKIHHAFMGTESANTLRKRFHITDTSTLNNYMSAATLHARNNAIEHSISLFEHCKIKTKQTFLHLLTQEMTKARHIVYTQTGRLPKSHITPINIQICGAALTNMRLEFIAKHILDDIHTK